MSKKLFEICISTTLEEGEIELEDHTSEIVFQLHCPLCDKTHQIDPDIGMLVYQLNGRPPPFT